LATEAVARRGDGGRPSAGWSGETRRTQHQQTHRPTRAVFCVLTGKSRLLARATKSSSRVSHRPLEPSTARVGSSRDCPLDHSSPRPLDHSTTQQLRSSPSSPVFFRRVMSTARVIDRSTTRAIPRLPTRPPDRSSARVIESSSRPGTAHESTWGTRGVESPLEISNDTPSR